MHSALYDTEVRHRRKEPAHQLRQRLRLAYLDLDEIEGAVGARRGWSTRPAPVWFRRRDYLDGGTGPLKDGVLDLVRDRTGEQLDGPVRVLTQLRTLGWVFNPLTTYYCFRPDGETLAAVVLEITNTPWHERFWYVLDAEQVHGRGAPFPKQFHVSPFLPMDLTYRCRVTEPGERLAIHFELTRGTTDPVRVFDADLTGERLPLDAPVRLRPALARATQTARVSLGIYGHAALLRLRGAVFQPHPDAHRTGRPALAAAADHPRTHRSTT